MNKVIRCGVLSGLAEEVSRLETLREEANTQISKLKVRVVNLTKEVTSVKCMLEHLSATGDEL